MKGLKELGVLVVDDDRAIFDVIARMFSHFKAKVDYAASTMDAFDQLKTREYKTMITNVAMPGVDGLKFIQKARELNPILNIVLFTGSTSEQLLNLALDPKVSEISGIHRKPYSLDDMLLGILTKETGKTFLLE
ncbi:MAG: response regulator [Desulfuromonadaceae bacterium]|nr:response regulator [Desulfuromonadaceae bacterium]